MVVFDAGGGGHRQRATERTQATDREAATGHADFLQAIAVGKFQLHPSHRGAQALAQGVDAHGRVGRHGDPGKALQAGTAAGHQGIAGGAFAQPSHIQAQAGIGDTDAGTARTEAGIDPCGRKQNLTRRRTFNREVATDLAKAGHVETQTRALQLQPIAIKVGGEVAADRQPGQAFDHRSAAQAAAADAARPQSEGATGVVDADVSTAAAKAHAGLGGVNCPDSVWADLFQGDGVVTRDAGTADVQCATDRDFKTWQCLRQCHGLAGRQGQRLCAGRPVDHRTCSVAGVVGRIDEPTRGGVVSTVDLQLGALQILHAITAHTDRAQAGAGGDPLPSAGAHDFGADHGCDVDIAQLGDVGGPIARTRAYRGRHPGATNDQLVDQGLRTIAQGDGLAQTAFNGKLTIDLQSVSQAQLGLTAETCLVGKQLHGKVAAGGGHQSFQRFTPAVVTQTQGCVQIEPRGLHGQLAIGLQGHFARDCAGCV